MTDRDLMKLALEALEFEASGWEDPPPITRDAITALTKRLAQPEQEPVARFSRWGEKGTSGEGYTVHFLGDRPLPPDGALFYTAPPQRRPLSDEQMWELWNLQGDDAMEQQEAIAFARAIEAKLKEKNT